MRRDPRFTRTEAALREALLDLMKKKPISEISTTELCDAADISRNTFYSHYDSPALLLEHIEDEFIAIVLEIVNSTMPTENYEMLIQSVCQAMVDHKELSSILLSENGSRNYLSRFISTMHSRVIDLWSQSSRLNRQALELIYNFSTFGVERCIRQWTSTGFRQTPEELARKLTAMTAVLYRHYMPAKEI